MTGRASGIKMGDDGDGSLISPDRVAHTAHIGWSDDLSLHHKVQKKISSGTGSPK